MAKELQSPGSFLAIMLEKYKLNPFKLSKDIHLSQSAVRLITMGKTKITTPVAMRLAKYFNTNPEFWLAMQMKWDIAEASHDKALVKLIKSISRVTKATASGASTKKAAPAKKKPATKKKKTATKKKATAKKKTPRKAAAKRPRLARKPGTKKRVVARKKAATRKKPTTRKKAVARKKTTAKKPRLRKPVARKKATVRKPTAKKPVRARKKTAAGRRGRSAKR